jgi:hypothetical protein
MRSAIAAVVVLAITVAGLVVLALGDPASAVDRPLAASRHAARTEQSPFSLGAERVLRCPVPEAGGPDLTDCPGDPPTLTAFVPLIGFGDLQRIRDEEEVGLR